MADCEMHCSATMDAFHDDSCQIVVHLDSLPTARNVDVKFVAGGHVFQVRPELEEVSSGPRFHPCNASLTRGRNAPSVTSSPHNGCKARPSSTNPPQHTEAPLLAPGNPCSKLRVFCRCTALPPASRPLPAFRRLLQAHRSAQRTNSSPAQGAIVSRSQMLRQNLPLSMTVSRMALIPTTIYQ